MSLKKTYNLKTNMIQALTNFLKVNSQTSKAYRLMVMLVFFISFTINWLFMQALIEENSFDIYRGIILRSLLESILLLVICHVFVRSYIKMHFLNQPIKYRLIIKLCVFLILVAILYFSLSYNMGKLEPLRVTDINMIQIINDNGIIETTISNSLLWTIGIAEYFLLLVGWSSAYIFWHSLKTRKKLQKQLQETQIKQLTNQLSPHFLFNTLNSIRALIYENQDTAAETLTQLSILVRKQLQSNLHVKSTLEKELDISAKYLSIEKLRLEERLTVNQQLDPAVLGQTLPSLTVLTLVENAVKHGISPNISPGFINIKAEKMTTKRWLFSISNSISSSKNKVLGTKIGLKNIKTRLEIMFGDNHSFKHQISKKEFTVKIELPYV